MAFRMTVVGLALLMSGCSMLPFPKQHTIVHNPFPQLSKVAVAPFFNLTTEPSTVVDGRQFALAYYNELQHIGGYEVVPVGVVEGTMKAHGLSMDRPADAQKLAQILEIDVVIVGAVTDFSPYFPPRCAMIVEWYAANPDFKPIPPGFGLPWGTLEELEIPPKVVLDSELAAARAEMERCQSAPPLLEGVSPVLRHVASYNGHDADVTEALADYVSLKDEPRFDGWPAYLRRSDDFIRFCCFRHIHQMLTARGGAETQVVWHWPRRR